jgi:hypothetical protein
MKKMRWTLVAVLLTTSFATVASAVPSTLDRCLSTIASSVSKLSDKWGRCASACEDAKRRGELASDVGCFFPSNEVLTQRCFMRAAERLTGARSPARRICKNDEVALFYGGSQTCSGSNGTVDQLLACLQELVGFNVDFLRQQIYRPIRAGICGDGVVSSFEECDPAAFPTGCPFDSLCHPRFCFCTFAGCGNGILEPGEDCDFNAFPNGCSFDEFCDFSSCECRGQGSAAEAFLEMPQDLTR